MSDPTAKPGRPNKFGGDDAEADATIRYMRKQREEAERNRAEDEGKKKPDDAPAAE